MNEPKLRFSEFNSGWKKFKIENTFSILNGYAFSSSDSVENGCRWIKIADVGINSMSSENPSFLPYEYKEKHSKYLLKEGDYVIALTRPILNGRLKISQIPSDLEESLLNQRVGKILSDNDENFIYYLLQGNHLINVIENHIAGTDPPNLSSKAIAPIKVSIPTRDEQQKIADFLSSVDQKIQQLGRKKELLEEYKKGVMQKLFSQEVRFKDENGEDFPDWESKRLEEILDINYGKDYKDLSEGNIPLIGTGGIMGYVDDHLYDKPSVLIGRKGTIDKPQFIDEPFWTVDTLFYTKVSESVDPYFAYLLVSRINLLKYNEASGVPSLSVRSLNSIKVKLPASFKEQLRIAKFVKNIDEKISHIEEKIDLTQAFKKGLLQQMFI